jgi:hypothetical protein
MQCIVIYLFNSPFVCFTQDFVFKGLNPFIKVVYNDETILELALSDKRLGF